MKYEANTRIYLAYADIFLSGMHFATVSAYVSVHAYMLAICHRSYQEAWTIQRFVACHQAHIAMSPMGWQWLRPRAMMSLKEK